MWESFYEVLILLVKLLINYICRLVNKVSWWKEGRDFQTDRFVSDKTGSKSF